MSPTPTSHIDESEPGQLLYELEQRQDQVLSELEQLEKRLDSVLGSLGVTLDNECDQALT